MSRTHQLMRMLERVDRRTFLKAAGVFGGAAVLGGGALRSALRVLEGDPVVTRQRVAMGTFVEVQAVCDSPDLADEAAARAFAEMDRLIAVLSRHDTDTPLSYLNRHGMLNDPPRELTDVVLHALDVNRRTGGAFDPTVKPLVDLLESGTFDEHAVTTAIRLVGADGVRFTDRSITFARGGMGLTLDGAAKGYIVDRMSDVMLDAGVRSHLVNAGGDIRTRGESAPGRPWAIAVEDPGKQGHYPDLIHMRDGAVATSGSYERFYDDDRAHHHIVDPATGDSPHRFVSVSVRAATVQEADALSTAVMVHSPRKSGWSRSPRFDYLAIGGDGSRHASPGWNAGVPASGA